MQFPNFWVQNNWGSLCGFIGNKLDCNSVVSEFKLQLHYYVRFWTNNLGKGMNLLIPFRYGLNRSTSVLLQGWLSYQITYGGWYAIKQKKKK